MQQIETIMELLDELREQEKKKHSSPQPPIHKKQIHFSDSGADYETEAVVIRDKEKSGAQTSSAFRSVKHELNVLPNRRHRKSIANSDISVHASSTTGPDRALILLARYSQFKKHLD